MKEFIDKLIDRLEENSFDMSLENPDCKAVWTDKAIDIVNELAQEYNNGWLPCSERLPGVMESCLVTLENGAVFQAIYTINEFINLLGKFTEDNKVIAWQPLPLPYKEGEKNG